MQRQFLIFSSRNFVIGVTLVVPGRFDLGAPTSVEKATLSERLRGQMALGKRPNGLIWAWQIARCGGVLLLLSCSVEKRETHARVPRAAVVFCEVSRCISEGAAAGSRVSLGDKFSGTWRDDRLLRTGGIHGKDLIAEVIKCERLAKVEIYKMGWVIQERDWRGRTRFIVEPLRAMKVQSTMCVASFLQKCEELADGRKGYALLTEWGFKYESAMASAVEPELLPVPRFLLEQLRDRGENVSSSEVFGHCRESVLEEGC